ncbi:MAG: inositol monophosphatase [Vampirovibrio sp.]|nr:inositol monophosphatase [Vampirovibrio sp.]
MFIENIKTVASNQLLNPIKTSSRPPVFGRNEEGGTNDVWQESLEKSLSSFLENHPTVRYPQQATGLSDLALYRPKTGIKPYHLPPVTLSKTELKRLSAAVEGCLQAGALIMRDYQKKHLIKCKRHAKDLQTDTDVNADTLISKILHVAEPDAELLTEETYQDSKKYNLSKTWIVDPLDGSTNYSHGYPNFSVSIAFIENGKPTMGVVLDLPKGTLYTAIKGKGAWSEGKRLKVSTVKDLNKTLLAGGYPWGSTGNPSRKAVNFFNDMDLKSQGIKAFGGVLGGTYTGAGLIDGYWTHYTRPWDQAASMLIATESGAKVTDFEGKAVDLSQPILKLVTANPVIHNQILKEFKKNSGKQQ